MLTPMLVHGGVTLCLVLTGVDGARTEAAGATSRAHDHVWPLRNMHVLRERVLLLRVKPDVRMCLVCVYPSGLCPNRSTEHRRGTVYLK